MRVSVIVATANRPHLLRRALASVVDQRGAVWEVLVVDDGDGSGVEAARSFEDARVRTFVNPGSGQVDARNAAIAAAVGEVVCWLDDDDWFEDTRHLERVVAGLRRGPALLHRGGWLVEVADDGSERARHPFSFAADAHTLRSDNTILNPGVAYHRVLHRELGLLDRALDGYYDWDWYLRVAAADVPIRAIAGLGVAYRVHGGNRSRAPMVERSRRFAALCDKHGLRTTMKHHVGLWEERAGACSHGMGDVRSALRART